jgi:hypothetical protein
MTVMSPTARRRLLLSSAVLFCGLNACTYERIGGYLWEFDASMPVCKEVTWHQVAPNRIPGLCGNEARAAAYGTSCAIGCVVVSQYSEAQAKHIDLWGDTLYAHERRHALERKVHPQ